MQSRVHRQSWCAAFAAAVMLGAGSVALANSGTQGPLNQYQAGTEHTSSALVTNGNFEQPGSPNPNPNPTGWGKVGSFQAGQPVNPNPAIPPSTIGNFAAQGPLGAGATEPNKFTQTVTLAPNTNYTLSAYLWNFAVDFDLAIAELVDPGDPSHTQTLALQRTAADGGDGANGYFVFKQFNSSFFSTANPILEVEYDQDETVSGTRPLIAGQIDNVAITLTSEFQAPRLIPEPAGLCLLALAGAMALRRR